MADLHPSVSDSFLAPPVKDLPSINLSTSSLCSSTLVFNFLLVSSKYFVSQFDHPMVPSYGKDTCTPAETLLTSKINIASFCDHNMNSYVYE